MKGLQLRVGKDEPQRKCNKSYQQLEHAQNKENGPKWAHFRQSNDKINGISQHIIDFVGST